MDLMSSPRRHAAWMVYQEQLLCRNGKQNPTTLRQNPVSGALVKAPERNNDS